MPQSLPTTWFIKSKLIIIEIHTKNEWNLFVNSYQKQKNNHELIHIYKTLLNDVNDENCELFILFNLVDGFFFFVKNYYHLSVNLDHISFENTVETFCQKIDKIPFLLQSKKRYGIFYSLMFCEIIERIYAIQVPLEQQRLRICLVEFQRIYDHLSYFLQWSTVMGPSWEKDILVSMIRHMSFFFNTLNMYCIPGGINRDFTHEMYEPCIDTIDKLKLFLDYYFKNLKMNSYWGARHNQNHINSADFIKNNSIGPNLRASGIKLDFRQLRIEYDKLLNSIPQGVYGTCWDRISVRIFECYESIRMIRKILSSLGKNIYFNQAWRERLDVQWPNEFHSEQNFNYAEGPNGPIALYCNFRLKKDANSIEIHFIDQQHKFLNIYNKVSKELIQDELKYFKPSLGANIGI